MRSPLNNLLNTISFKLFLACILFLMASVGMAKESYVLNVKNPNKKIVYVVGDVFTRTIELDVKAPYKLSKSSIPAKGLQQKGIELSAVKVTEKQAAKSTHYQLHLKYQLFTSGPNVMKLKIAKHPLLITHAGKSFKVHIPQWTFRVSPLAVNNEVYIEQDMSPYRGPLLVEVTNTKYVLGNFLLLTLVATCGLIYINADNAWFPGMGGPFAKSYRQINSYTGADVDKVVLQKAAASIHHAFNQTFGQNVFATDIERFVQRHPAFANIKHEIAQFFKASNYILFSVNDREKSSVTLVELMNFCSQFRHCERKVA